MNEETEEPKRRASTGVALADVLIGVAVAVARELRGLRGLASTSGSPCPSLNMLKLRRLLHIGTQGTRHTRHEGGEEEEAEGEEERYLYFLFAEKHQRIEPSPAMGRRRACAVKRNLEQG